MNTAAEVRAKLVEALGLDLVGPRPAHRFAGGLLPENPNRWHYLTGYLVPQLTPAQGEMGSRPQRAWFRQIA